jgi:hypothetical protein
MLEASGDVAQRSEPVERGCRRRGLGEAGALVVAQRREGLDVLVVLPPAARDDVMVEVREPPLQLLDPGSKLIPFRCGINSRDLGPVRRAGYLFQILVVVGAEHELSEHAFASRVAVVVMEFAHLPFSLLALRRRRLTITSLA